MSQVMNALQHSENSRQAILGSHTYMPNGESLPLVSRPKWAYMILLGLLPIVGVASYLGIETYRVHVVKGASADVNVNVSVDSTLPLSQVAFIAAPDQKSSMGDDANFHLLSYPSFSRLEPVPRLLSVKTTVNDLSEHELAADIDAKPTKMTEMPYIEMNANEVSQAPMRAKNDGHESDMELDDLDLSSLSPELAMKFQSALQATAQQGMFESEGNPSNQEVLDIEKIGIQFQGRLPALNLQTHMYSSDKQRRWVKINNHEYYEGDWIDNQVQLLKVKPQSIVVKFEDLQLKLPALYEWQG